LHIADELKDKLPDMVLWDLVTYGWGLWDLLDTHAHAETRAVHQCIARTLPGGDASQEE